MLFVWVIDDSIMLVDVMLIMISVLMFWVMSCVCRLVLKNMFVWWVMISGLLGCLVSFG